jgi:FkbM family methyltransferase
MIKIRSTARRVLRHPITGQVTALKLPMQSTDDLRRLGNVYGGAWVPTAELEPGGICYSVGVGQDITFDLELIERYGMRVWGFDPTPRVIDWIATQDLPAQYTFLPYGIWDKDDVVKFYVPENPDHVSHSIDNIQETDQYITGEVKRLSTAMRELGHTRIDLLKMNIEGAEGAVVDDALAARIPIRVLSVVFEQNESPRKLRARIRRVLDAGYVLRHVEGWHYTFVSEAR